MGRYDKHMTNVHMDMTNNMTEETQRIFQTTGLNNSLRAMLARHAFFDSCLRRLTPVQVLLTPRVDMT